MSLQDRVKHPMLVFLLIILYSRPMYQIKKCIYLYASGRTLLHGIEIEICLYGFIQVWVKDVLYRTNIVFFSGLTFLNIKPSKNETFIII